MTAALIVMAKRPRAGETKTRLCPPLDWDQAAALYECFLRDTIATAEAVTAGAPEVTPYIAYPEAEDPAYFAGLSANCALVLQRGPDLGARLDAVLSATLAEGHAAAIAINSDSPQLPAATVRQAVEVLEGGAADVVLGPCDDGGYYLIGVTRPSPELTRSVRMSAADTLAQTVAAAEAEGLRVRLLPPAYDVDMWGDVLRLRDDLKDSELAPHTRDWLGDWNHRRLFRFFCAG